MPLAGLASSHASACAGSSAGMIPSSSARRRNAASASSSVDGVVASRGPRRAARRARGPSPGSRARPRPSAPPAPGRPRPGAPPTARRAGRRARRWSAGAEWRPVSSPSPAASTPTSSTSASSQEGHERADRVRAAADAGDHAVGQPALGGLDLLARLVADHALEVAHQRRVGRRAHRRADHVVGGGHVGHPVADRRADRLLERAGAGLDRRRPRRRAAPSAPRWAAGGACPRCPCRRRTRGPSSAHAVAVATPCWPAPVSAITRRLPIRLASSAWPSALLILCAPVWSRSSRLR